MAHPDDSSTPKDSSTPDETFIFDSILDSFEPAPSEFRTPNPAGPHFLRRLVLDALFELDWSHNLCRCWSCSRLRHLLDRLGLTFERWDPDSPIQLTRKEHSNSVDSLLVGILIREVWLLQHCEGQPLQSILEVPSAVGSLLWDDGWGPILLATEEHRDSSRRLEDQALWIRSARRQFIEELAKAALPDDRLRHVDLSNPVDFGRSLDDDQSEQVIAEHLADFERWGITFPKIPSSVVPHLRFDGVLYGIATEGVRIGAIAGYDLQQWRPRAHAPLDFLDPDLPNYFLASGRGNEGGSYWGFAIRGGEMFASVQVQTGRYESEFSSRASRIIELHNELLFPHLDQPNREGRVAVGFSTFRKFAYVAADGIYPIEPMEPRHSVPPRWSCVLDLSDVKNDDIAEIARRVNEARSMARGRENVLAAIEFVWRAHLA